MPFLKKLCGGLFAACLIGTFLMNVPARAAVRFDNINVGDKVIFGVYEQDDKKDGNESLEWLVLEKNEDDKEALLITSDCIECMPFHTEQKDIAWKDSSIRQWLNSVFLQTAFNDGERDSILEKKIETPVNEDYSDEGTIETNDYVFLLSDGEAKKWFGGKEDRQAHVSPLIHSRIKEDDEEEDKDSEEDNGEENGAGASGAGDREPAVSELTDAAFWWLRTPGDHQDCVACVGAEGSVVISGYLATLPDFGVRPAIWIKIT